ncbi:Zinc finger CCHC-type [Trinorchestia longiramus]|nr:Zinc finger CCHC-type [Trinorchestia longiramus]
MERRLTGLTGYGPSNLTFDGNDEWYELWEVKFWAYLDLKSLNSVLEGEESSLDVVKNKQVFSELVQRLDDKSLSLIIRDAYGDGRKSMKILRDHYLGSSKPRIISLYCQLAALKMRNGETVTDYFLRAETTASYLKRAGEMISDGLIIAMIIRGLPAAYNTFSTVVTQRDSAEMDFQKFKSALKSEEETKKNRQSHSENEERVMKVQDSKIICYLCGKSGHKKVECKNYSAKKNRWCSIYKSASHDTKFCRKKDTVKAMATDRKDVKGSFCFRVTTDSFLPHRYPVSSNSIRAFSLSDRSPRQRLLLTNNQRATCTCTTSRAHNHSNDTYTTGLNLQLTLPRIISPSSSGVAVETPGGPALGFFITTFITTFLSVFITTFISAFSSQLSSSHSFQHSSLLFHHSFHHRPHFSSYLSFHCSQCSLLSLSAHCFHLIVAFLHPILDHIADHIADHIPDHISYYVLDPIFDHILDHHF